MATNQAQNASSSTRRAAGRPAGSGATLGFESKLWQAADKLRHHLDAAEYKHVVLGLIFLKYVSDAIEDGAFEVPPEAVWQFLRACAADSKRSDDIGKRIDDAMAAIERANPTLFGVLPKDYARPALDKTRLAELVLLIDGIELIDRENRSRDVLGRVYEYFLSRFAAAEGKKGGQFYTPQCVVRLLVEMLAPYRGRVLDPCCGSGGLFVQSEKFVAAHGGQRGDVHVYGQESNHTTWRLARLNLSIRGIAARIEHGDSLHADAHKGLLADYVLSNPPFNARDWGEPRLRDDPRFIYGLPPSGNANFAWVQHFLHHLSPLGIAGFVLANGSLSSRQLGEGAIRQRIVEADVVDCIVALPGQLFYSTQIPVCLWFLSRNKEHGLGRRGRRMRDRRQQTLFIDGRKLGTMVSRVHRELSDADIARLSGTYHRWRGDGDGAYADVAGFCKSATLDEIRGHAHALTPGRYVGAAEVAEEDEPFDQKMRRLSSRLEAQFADWTQLEREIRDNLRGLGYGG